MNDTIVSQLEKAVMFLRTWSLKAETEYNARVRALAASDNPSAGIHALMSNSSKTLRSDPGLFRTPSMSSLARSGNGGGRSHPADATGASTFEEVPVSSVSAGATKLQHRNSTLNEAPETERMSLMGVDGFKRLEYHLSAWLRSEKVGGGAAPSRSKAEGFRGTFVRTFTARNNVGPTLAEG